MVDWCKSNSYIHVVLPTTTIFYIEPAAARGLMSHITSDNHSGYLNDFNITGKNLHCLHFEMCPFAGYVGCGLYYKPSSKVAKAITISIRLHLGCLVSKAVS